MDKNADKWRDVVKGIADQDSEPHKSPNPSEENDHLMEEAKATWTKTNLNNPEFSPNVEKAWNSFQLKARFRSSHRASAYPNLWKIAASVSLLLICGWLLWQSQIKTGSHTIFIAATDTVQRVDLPDGSRIWLNEHSSLSYLNDFNLQREVQLKGEGFFEIAKKDGASFTVLTNQTKTTVLGTSFNIKESKDGSVKVQVTTGKVAFTPRTEKAPPSVLLTPGKEALYTPEETSRELKLVTKPIEDQNYRAWQNKVLVFSNKALPAIVSKLSEHYQKPIHVSDDLSACRFTVSFIHQSLDEVLDILSITGDLTIKKLNNEYYITGQPCNE